jgi:hypothetical protein
LMKSVQRRTAYADLRYLTHSKPPSAPITFESVGDLIDRIRWYDFINPQRGKT